MSDVLEDVIDAAVGARGRGGGSRRCSLVLRRAPRRATLVPPKPNVFLGVSDRGTTTSSTHFAELTGKHPALLRDLPPLGQQPQPGLRTLARNRDAADPPHLDRRRPDPGRADHPASRSRSAAATTTCCSSTTSSPSTACPPTSGRWASRTAASTPGRRSTATAPERRRAHDRLVQAGLPPDRR